VTLSPDAGRLAAAAVVAFAYLLGCGLLWLGRRRRSRRRMAAGPADGAALLVAYASQTGFAELLAERTAAALRAANLPVRLLPLGEVDARLLGRTQRALFIASTTGEGDAPDPAARFVGRVMPAAPALAGLAYGVLALGDRDYRNFCAFGRRLDGWLRERGARPLFDATEVDDGDTGALRHWQSCLGGLTGHAGMADWSRPAYAPWRLEERRLLNPGSPGGPAFHLAFAPPPGAGWQAGDIAEVGPRNDPAAVAAFLRGLGLDAPQAPFADRLLPADEDARRQLAGLSAAAVAAALPALPHREYSIASLPQDGRLELLVRLMRHPDGRAGLGSGWLCLLAEPGGTVDLRIRRNAAFHAPADDRPLLLVGNGTGMAGLRAQLKARALAGRGRNWLLFGERTRAHDFFHGQEIEAWRARGLLARVDLAFSRDGPERRYVQHLLAERSDEVRAWVAGGAAVYVCGSLDGMAAGVDAALAAALGPEALARLAEEGRYRRDVY